MSEKSLLFCFSSSSHLKLFTAALQPFSWTPGRPRRSEIAAMLALTFQFLRFEAKVTRASQAAAPDRLLSRPIKTSSITHNLIGCKTEEISRDLLKSVSTHFRDCAFFQNMVINKMHMPQRVLLNSLWYD